jgi:hypothetical protein
MQDERDNDGGIEYWQTTNQPQKRPMRYLSGKTGSEDFPVLSEGSHVARCYAVLDLGTHEKVWQGQKKMERQVRVVWEVPGERMNDGRPMAISRTYKASLHEKSSLRKNIESWRGKRLSEAEVDNFDITMLLGRPAMLGVVHTTGADGGVFAGVDTIMVPPKGTPVPAQENKSIFFDLDDFDPEIYETLGKGVKAKIAKSPEFISATSRSSFAGNPAGDMDDDVPFANPFRGVKSYVV